MEGNALISFCRNLQLIAEYSTKRYYIHHVSSNFSGFDFLRDVRNDHPGNFRTPVDYFGLRCFDTAFGIWFGNAFVGSRNGNPQCKEHFHGGLLVCKGS